MSATESRRNVLSYALRIAAFAAGIGIAGYHKLFGRHLGMNVTTDKMFNRVIEEAYPHITEMLNEVCELGKEEMKNVPTTSWEAGNEQLRHRMAVGTSGHSSRRIAPWLSATG